MRVTDRTMWFMWHVLPIRPIARLDERDWLIGLCSLSKRGPGFLIGTRTERASISLYVEYWRAKPRRPLTDVVSRQHVRHRRGRARRRRRRA